MSSMGFLIHSTMPVVIVFAAEVVPAGSISTTYGILFTAAGLSSFTPALFGYLVDIAGFNTAYNLLAVVVILGSLSVVLARERRPT